MVAILSALLISALAAFAWAMGLYTRAKVQLSTVTVERDRLKDAHETARGYLYGIATSSIPGVSDGATRVLDDIDTTVRKDR